MNRDQILAEARDKGDGTIDAVIEIARRDGAKRERTRLRAMREGLDADLTGWLDELLSDELDLGGVANGQVAELVATHMATHISAAQLDEREAIVRYLDRESAGYDKIRNGDNAAAIVAYFARQIEGKAHQS